MARSRNIKPAFFMNDQLGELPPLTRLLFIALWGQADRKGRLEDRPKRIKVLALPYDEIDTDEALSELHRTGFIERYQVEGERFIWVVKFSNHQNPHHREAASTIPAPGKPEESPGQASEKASPSPSDSLNLIPDSLNRTPDSLNSVDKSTGEYPPSKELNFWDVAVSHGIARSLVGKWIKDHSESRVAKVIATISVKRPADPVQYVTAMLQDRPKKLYVPAADDSLVPWAEQHGFPKPGGTETYHHYRHRLRGLVRLQAEHS